MFGKLLIRNSPGRLLKQVAGKWSAPSSRHHVTNLRARQLQTWARAGSTRKGAFGKHHAHTQAQPKDADAAAMFCYQCEQTKLRKGCTVVGVCGKTPEVAALQDLLVHVIKGLSLYGHELVSMGARQALSDDIYEFTFSALFSTLTNVNFDADRFPAYIHKALSIREELRGQYEAACAERGTQPRVFDTDEALWRPDNNNYLTDPSLLHDKGHSVGVLQDKDIYGEDIAGVRQMAIYGLKGMSTYARHGSLLGQWDNRIGQFTLEAFAWLTAGPLEERTDLGANLTMALRVGEWNLRGMELLDNGHRERFGVPNPASVRTSPVPGKGILVSGHDMHDLDLILKATEGKGINVYTHGEMLPAHGYPRLKEQKHLVGQFGSAWQLQKFEFPAFPGPIVVTTNCLTEPLKSYKDRLYTLNDCGWPGAKHLELPRDLDVLLDKAEECGGFTEEECEGKVGKKALTTGFGHDVILSQADTIVKALQSGTLRHMFVIGGCDGAEHKRNYFSTLADSVPTDSIILTMGCAKYRFNSHEFGELAQTGIPRLLDMGQCNDAYGAVVIAKALAQAFSTDVNSLPLSIDLSWFEQKAVAVLLSLLHLGIQNIRVGPVLPAFLTPNVLAILKDKFNLQPVDIRHPLEDMKHMLEDD